MKHISVKRYLNVLAISISLCVMAVSFNSCFDSDDVGGAYYTFVGETVASVLQSDAYTHIFGEFCRVLDTTEIINLLSTYGTFTVFAPVDSAMISYYRDSITALDPNATEFTLEKFLSQNPDRMEVLKEMVYYQIIDKATYITAEFPENHLEEKNMKSRYINVSFKNLGTTGYITVNDNSNIVIKDKEVHNGVVHGVDRVLVPSKEFMAEKAAADPRFSIFAEALYCTKLSEKVLLIRDEDYEQPTVFRDQNGEEAETPEERLYWFTALAESDATYLKKGVVTDTSNIGQCIDELRKYAAKVYDEVYPQYADLYDDIENPNNSFNRFMAYHLFDHMAYENGFVYNVAYAPTYDPVDYIVPMAPNALIEARERDMIVPTYDSNGNQIGSKWTNRTVFNVKSDGSYVTLLDMVFTCQNAMMYEIDDILLYDDKVQNDVFNKRLRIDVFALCSELMNIDYRPTAMGASSDKNMWFPSDYFSWLEYDDEKTKVNKPKMMSGSVQHQGIMFYLYGQFDFTLTVPSIPQGTWEVRIGIKHRGNALAQLYIDDRPAGVPVNLSETGKRFKNAQIKDEETGETYTYNPDNGWKPDVYLKDETGKVTTTLDEEATAQIDKDMRNLGWMKAPSSITQLPGSTKFARSEANSTRFILGQFDFDDNTTHTIRAKWVGEDQLVDDGDAYFGLDYIEFIPKALIDEEGRD